jgi:hypothetical protein
MTFTESFIALCREYPLERETREGDYLAQWRDPHKFPPPADSHPSWFEPSFAVFVLCDECNGGGAGKAPSDQQEWGGRTERWIPRLDQLRDLLEAAMGGHNTDLCFFGNREVGYACEADYMSINVQGKGSSPEEAAYRLLLAVREAANERKRRPPAG